MQKRRIALLAAIPLVTGLAVAGSAAAAYADPTNGHADCVGVSSSAGFPFGHILPGVPPAGGISDKATNGPCSG
jgi:hypothetical protein